jgi:phosphorylcholine metabolism protein LicD
MYDGKNSITDAINKKMQKNRARYEIYITEYKRGRMMNIDLARRSDYFLISFNRHYMLFKLLKKLDDLLVRNNIEYFISSGVLIGLMRHNNSFIPWDDDVDVCVFEKDKNRIIEIISNDPEICFISSKWDTMKIIHKYNKMMNLPINDNVTIDILFYEKCDSDTYNFTNENHKKWFPTEWFKQDEIFPIKKEKLKLYFPDGLVCDDIDINVPYNYQNYLNRTYPNFMEKMICRSDGIHCTVYKNFIAN